MSIISSVTSGAATFAKGVTGFLTDLVMVYPKMVVNITVSAYNAAMHNDPAVTSLTGGVKDAADGTLKMAGGGVKLLANGAIDLGAGLINDFDHGLHNMPKINQSGPGQGMS